MREAIRRVLDRTERSLPKLAVWFVVLCCIGALFTKWRYGRPAATPVHYLLAIILFAGLMPVLGPKLEEYVVSRVRKLGVGGFKVELFQKQVARSRLEGELPTGALLPLMADELGGPGMYWYERLSFWLYLKFDQGEDPNKLDAESKDQYRSIIIAVGRAAGIMGHGTKCLQVLSHLRSFTDRGLNSDEQFLLGSAYIYAARELSAESERRAYYRKSLPLLRGAAKKNPRSVKILFNLAWVLDELGRYDKAIEYLRICIAADKKSVPLARRNIASAMVKQRRFTEAIQELTGIGPGSWWTEIAKDSDFLAVQNSHFRQEFENLCKLRQQEGQSQRLTPNGAAT